MFFIYKAGDQLVRRGLAMALITTQIFLPLPYARAQTISGQSADPNAQAASVSQIKPINLFSSADINPNLAAQKIQSCEDTALGPNFKTQYQDLYDTTDPLSMGATALGGAAASLAKGDNIKDAAGSSIDALNGGACRGQIKNPNKPKDCSAAQYKTGSGGFNEKAVLSAIKEYKTQRSLALCKSLNAQRAEAAASCYRDEIESLKNAMRDTKEYFEKELKNKETYVNKTKELIQKEEQKSEALTGKIKSLEETKQKVAGLLAQLNAGSQGGGDDKSIAGLDRRLKDHEIKVKTFEMDKAKEVGRQTANCIRTSGSPNSRIQVCPTGSGELNTPWKCIATIYGERIGKQTANGGRTDTPQVKKVVGYQTNLFENIAKRAISDLEGTYPTSNTVDAWVSRWAGKLSGFGAEGKLLVEEVKECQKYEKQIFDQKLNDPQSEFGSQAASLDQTSRTISSEMSSLLKADTGIDGVMRDSIKELFGAEANGSFSTDGCTQNLSNDDSGTSVSIRPQALRTQLSCIKGAVANLESLLKGTAPPTLPGKAPVNLRVPLQVQGLDTKFSSCAGLRDCILVANQAKAKAENDRKSMEGDGLYKSDSCSNPNGCPGLKRFFKEVNASYRTALQDAANQFKARVLATKAFQSRMRAMLEAAGGKFASKKADAKSLDEICPKASNDSEMCKVPANFDETLGSLAGLNVVEPEELSSAQESLSSQKEKNQDFVSQFNGDISQLEGLLTSCKSDAADKSLAKKLNLKKNDINKKLIRCKTLAGKSVAKQEEFSNGFEKLHDDIAAICKAEAAKDASSDKQAECAALSTDVLAAQEECTSIVADSKKKAVEEKTLKCLAYVSNKAAYDECVNGLGTAAK